MRKLVLVLLLGVVLIAGVVVDAAAEAQAEAEVVATIERGVGATGEVEADVVSFPFLGRLLVQERVSRLQVRLTDVTGYGIGVAELRVVAEGIRLDRGLLLGGDVEVTGVDLVRAEARITEAEIRRATGAEVDLLGDGRARITARGVAVVARVEVEGGQVRFAADPLPGIALPLPASGLLPCAPSVEVVAGALLARCEAARLPQILLDAIG